jgi:hypothetical protein
MLSAQSEHIIRFDNGRDDEPHAVTTDASGAILLAGRSDSLTNPISFAVVKQSAAGATQWLARFQGTAEQTFGTAADVAVDAAGNVYAAGNIARPTGLLQYNWDALVVSFSAAGGQRWAHVYNGPDNGRDAASKVVVDPSGAGALYVAGTTTMGGRLDLLLSKYSLAGTLTWQRLFSVASSVEEQPMGLARTADGGVLVALQTFDSAAGFERDVALVRFDAAGNQLWSRVFSETAISDEEFGGFAIDAAGHIYLSGAVIETTNPELPQNLFTAKFTSSGQFLYFVKGRKHGGAIAVGPDGNPVVCGLSFTGGGNDLQTWLAKLDAGTGTLLWSAPTVTAGRVAVDIDGSIYTAGTRFIGTSSTPYDYSTALFTASGQELWSRIVTAGDRVSAVHLDAAGNFLVTGSGPGTRLDFVTVRYTEDFVPPPPPPPVTPPAAPSALKLAAAKGKLTLSWTDNANNETGFTIERSVNGGAFALIAQVGANVRTYANSGLSKSNSYSYRVRAFNAGGNSAFSNTATGRPK